MDLENLILEEKRKLWALPSSPHGRSRAIAEQLPDTIRFWEARIRDGEMRIASAEGFAGAGQVPGRFTAWYMRDSRAFIRAFPVPVNEVGQVLYNMCTKGLSEEDNVPHTMIDLCPRLRYLGMLPVVVKWAARAFYEAIDAKVEHTCADSLERAALPLLTAWMRKRLFPWLEVLINPDKTERSYIDETGLDSTEGLQMLIDWKNRLSYHLAEEIMTNRISRMFDIVVEYPDSTPVLDDIRDCLQRTDAKERLIGSFTDQLCARLLHDGAMTTDIISQYVNTIKACYYIDPRGIILDKVSLPVREYLRRRPDTIRCIVEGLTGDGDLADELRLASSTQTVLTGLDSDDEAETADDFDEWQPTPRDAAPSKWRSGKGGDIIAALLAIYSSRELFIDEYREMLAEKLLGRLGPDFDREVRNVELLKVKFGDQAMRKASVMVKDMSDSNRIAAQAMKTARSKDIDVAHRLERTEVAIITKLFWPKHANNDIETDVFDEFTTPLQEEFEKLKNPRKLRWNYSVGAVNLSLTFDDGRSVKATATPAQTALLKCFEESRVWSTALLAERVKTSEEQIKKKIAIWLSSGVLRETEDRLGYEVIEEISATDQPMRPEAVYVEMPETDQLAVQEAKEAEELKVHENFIFGMLNNRGPMTMENIHNSLRIFSQYNKGEKKLQSLLNSLASQKTLAEEDGVYSLPK